MMVESHILIVDGSAAEAAGLARALAGDGHRVEVAADPAAAAHALRAERAPDLLLLDLAFPHLDTVGLLAGLEGSDRRGLLPVIAIAAEGDADGRVRALRAGADDAVARPCAPAEVAARAAALLRLRAAHQRLREANLELTQRSITDPLTGLFNRRYFEYRLAQELERARRHGDPVALAFLDLDHFKRINDTYGHATGDAVLLAVARVLQEELRRLDVCTRWGGEEFAAILPNTDAAGAMVVSQRVLRALRSHGGLVAPPLGSDAGEVVRFTASMGVAVHEPASSHGAEELLRRADGALYLAKRQGRNRARVATAAPTPTRTPVVRSRPAVA
ncbi:MAG: diguanylate cyclase [Deltaproteobacteria bacterium]|nr:diguanylate cyclase [Deltaproteobacteria bacterium]